YAVPESDLYIVEGSAQGVSFMGDIGIVPLENPHLVRKVKTDDGGHWEASVSELLGKAKEGDKKDSKGKNERWVSFVLKAKTDGSTTRIVSAPMQLN
ncbi:MAG: hypothetical protein K2X81_22435, partial [Candidatus Obscuribacterales bacterium]|nr:hypothetical protein [Candidatus Obscuribacterales bacterium]